MKYPIFLIENHYIIKLFNILYLLNEFGENKKKKWILNENKLKYLIFFIENIEILDKIEKKEKLNIKIVEKILEQGEIDGIIKFGILKEMIEIKLEKTNIYYNISEKGKEILNKTTSYEFFNKKELAIVNKIIKLSDQKIFDLFI